MAKINPTTTIPNPQSSVQQWVDWYDALKGRYGKKTARTLWQEAWDKYGQGSSANNTDLRNEMERRGVSVSGETVLSDVADFGSDTLDFISGTFGTAKTLVLVFFGIIILTVLFIVIRVVLKPKEYAELAQGVASARTGRMAK